MNKRMFIVGLCVIISSCSSVKVRYETKNRYFQPKNGPVCLLPSGVPDNIRYELIGHISASIKHNASRERVAPLIADKARQLGADAVLNFIAEQRFRSPLPWAIVGPRGNGAVIRLLPDSPPLDCIAAGGITY